MRNCALAKTVEPEFQVLQLNNFAIWDRNKMSDREIGIVRARAKTGKFGKALIKNLRELLGSVPDFPILWVSCVHDRRRAVRLFAQRSTPDSDKPPQMFPQFALWNPVDPLRVVPGGSQEPPSIHSHTRLC